MSLFDKDTRIFRCCFICLFMLRIVLIIENKENANMKIKQINKKYNIFAFPLSVMISVFLAFLVSMLKQEM